MVIRGSRPPPCHAHPPSYLALINRRIKDMVIRGGENIYPRWGGGLPAARRGAGRLCRREAAALPPAAPSRRVPSVFLPALRRSSARRITAEATQGADDGELFLEYRQSEALVFDNSRLKTASYDTSQGFGLRVDGRQMDVAARVLPNPRLTYGFPANFDPKARRRRRPPADMPAWRRSRRRRARAPRPERRSTRGRRRRRRRATCSR